MIEGKIVQYAIEGDHPFDTPSALPKSRSEHLDMQMGWNEKMVGLLLKRKADLLREIAGIDGQVQTIHQSTRQLRYDKQNLQKKVG